MTLTVRKTRTSTRTTICSAISSREVIWFYYHGGFRFAEPYCYGVLYDGNEALLCYQVGGHSEFDDPTGWKLFRAYEISSLEVTSESFACVKREYDSEYDSRYSVFTTICCQVIASTADEGDPKESMRVTQRAEREKPDYNYHEKYVVSFQKHNQDMRRFRLSHLISPLNSVGYHHETEVTSNERWTIAFILSFIPLGLWLSFLIFKFGMNLSTFPWVLFAIPAVPYIGFQVCLAMLAFGTAITRKPTMEKYVNSMILGVKTFRGLSINKTVLSNACLV